VASVLEEKWLYLRARSVNAWLLLKNGDFRLIYINTIIEFRRHTANLKCAILSVLHLDEDRVRDSAFSNQIKVVPRTNRVTASRMADRNVLTVNPSALQSQITKYIRDLNIQEIKSSKWRK
jgi:hypothetical protein